MKAIILAAGRGSRLNALTDDKPKCMVELNSRPLLDWQIHSLSESGIDEIAVVCGYQKDEIIHPKISHFFYNKEWNDTNMVVSLTKAREWLSKDDCIVSYSDIFYSSKIIQLLININSDLAITYDPDFMDLWSQRFEKPLEDLDVFQVDSERYLSKIGKNPNSISEIHGQFMGLLKFTPNSWRDAEKVLSTFDFSKVYMTSFLNILISNNIKIKTVSIDKQPWGEVDHPSDLILYENKMNSLHLFS